MTQTKRCPFFKFGSWWCFSRQTPQESDCEINASFAQGCACVINAARRCGVPSTGCCGTGPCLDQSSDGITDHQGQSGLSWRRLAVAKLEVVSGCRGNWPLHCGNSSLQQATLFAHFFPERRVVWLHFCSVQVEFLVVLWPLGCPVRLQQKHSAGRFLLFWDFGSLFLP